MPSGTCHVHWIIFEIAWGRPRKPVIPENPAPVGDCSSQDTVVRDTAESHHRVETCGGAMNLWEYLKAAFAAKEEARWRYLPKWYGVEEEDAISRLSTMAAKQDAAEIANKGNFKALVDARREIVEMLNLHPPSVEIRVKGLTIKAEAHKGGERVPTVWSSFKLFVRSKMKKPVTKEVTILDNLNLLLRPGEANLLLGPPGAGKTVLLKLLADRLVEKEQWYVDGKILYNGRTATEFEAKSTCAYVDQEDKHIPLLTVRETVRFTSRCSGDLFIQALRQKIQEKEEEDPTFFEHIPPELKEGMAKLSSRKFREEIILHLLGLSRCADTIVGDSHQRGISGGEKKRVTTGEQLAATRRVIFFDDISTGLDSSTTFSVNDTLVHLTHNFQLTTLFNLLQPPPETYNLFDNIILIAEGKLLYCGPRDGVLPFFASIGFLKPPQVEIGDFLQQLMTKKGQSVFFQGSAEAPHSKCVKFGDTENFVVPFETIQEHFYRSEHGKELMEQLEEDSFPTPQGDEGLLFQTFQVSYITHVKILFLRWARIIFRDKKLMIGLRLQNIFVGLVLGTLFYDMKVPENFISIFGVMFTAMMFLSFRSSTQSYVAQIYRGIFLKQRDAKFFRATSYTVSAALLYLPLALEDSIVLASIVYFMVGLSRNGPGYFFTFLLVVFSQASCMGALYRMIGNLATSTLHASAYGGTVILVLASMSGYTIVRGSIPVYWIWAYYASPFSFAIRALAINEMTSPQWGQQLGNGRTVGEEALLNFGFFTDRIWIWMGVLVLWIYYLLFTLITGIALNFVSKEYAPAVLQEEQENDTGFREMSNEHLPFEPTILAFRNIMYFIPSKNQPDGKFCLLHGISGYACPGTITALMGPSGAGKTTLADVIVGRKTIGDVSGEITLNGHIKVQETFRRVTGYVEQTDIHSPLTTVQEAVRFSAALRLSREISRKRKWEFSDYIIGMVGLEGVCLDMVGRPFGKGLSQEQRKRLTIAVELVANPSIIFLDEPTSGLDSNGARMVMQAVQNVAQSGRTIVCTIHQPSREIFNMFQSLLLLQRGGHTVFFGEMGEQCADLVKYMEAIPGVLPFAADINPANWILEITSTNQDPEKFVEHYQSSALRATNEKKIAEYSVPRPGSEPIHFASKYATPLHVQFLHCFTKHLKTYWRSPAFNGMRYVMSAAMALLFGSIYWDQGSDIQTNTDVQNILGALYSSSMFLGNFNLFAIQSVIAVERSVFYRERATGMYAALPFSLSLQIVEIPYVAVQSTLYVSIMYFMIGFVPEIGKFFFFLLVTFLNSWLLTTLGIFLACITPTEEIAYTVSNVFVQLWAQFSGFAQRRPEIPTGWIWMYWLTPLSYALYALTMGEYGNVSTPIILVTGETTTVAQYLEDFLGYNFSFRWWCVLILFSFLSVFSIGITVTLAKLNFTSR